MATLRSLNVVLGADMVSKGFNALTILATMRFLSAQEFGDYVFVTAIALASYGLFNGYFNRAIVFGDILEADLSSSLLTAIGLTAAAYGIVAFASNLRQPVLFAAGLAVALSLIAYDFARSILQRRQVFGRYSAAEIARNVFFFAATIAVIFKIENSRPIYLLWALSVSYVLALGIVGTGDLWRSGISSQRILDSAWRLASKRPFVLLIYFGLLGVTAQLPLLLYRPLAGTEQYAEFGVAFRYYGLLVAITSAFHVVVMPSLAQTPSDQAEALFRRLLHLSLFTLGAVTVAVAVGFFAIPLVDQGEYPGAPLLFAVLATGLVFGVYVGIISSACLRNGAEMLLVVSQGLVAVVTAGIISRFGADHVIAAAAAMPLGLACQLVVMVVYFRNRGLTGLLSDRRN